MDITSRAQWGAAPPRSKPIPVSWKGTRHLWAHHTVGNYVKPDYGDSASWLRVLLAPAKYTAALVAKVRMLKARNDATRKQTVEAEKAAMRAIQAFHQKGRGWADIGYAFVVFQSGRVYEGRGAGVIAAHCPGHNHEPSCAFAGDYSKQAPTQRSIEGFDDLRKHLGLVGWRGHRDGYPTACPGDALYGALRRSIPRN